MTRFSSERARLRAHVARLAEADQVLALVRFLCRRKLAERANMVHRQARADMRPAVCAASVLLRDDSRSRFSPSSAPVGFRAADPIRGILAGSRSFPVGGFAGEGAELATVTVPQAPRWLVECRRAVGTCQAKRRDVIRVSRSVHNGRSGVFSRVAANAVHARNVVRPKAGPGAEASASGFRRQDGHCRTARLAMLDNASGLSHARTIPQFGGAGTTGLVADRHQRNATLIELNPAYAALARNRIHADAPLFVGAAE